MTKLLPFALTLIAASLLCGCFEEPFLELREAVPSPESKVSPGAFVLGMGFPKYDALRSCSPCVKHQLNTGAGPGPALHVTPNVRYPISKDQIEATFVTQHYGLLSYRDFFYTLECQISHDVVVDILEAEEDRGRGGILIPFHERKPVAYGTSSYGPCFLGRFNSRRAAETRARELGLDFRLVELSQAEIDSARSDEQDLIISLVNSYICEEIPFERPLDPEILRDRIPPERMAELECDF